LHVRSGYHTKKKNDGWIHRKTQPRKKKGAQSLNTFTSTWTCPDHQTQSTTSTSLSHSTCSLRESRPSYP